MPMTRIGCKKHLELSNCDISRAEQSALLRLLINLKYIYLPTRFDKLTGYGTKTIFLLLFLQKYAKIIMNYVNNVTAVGKENRL